MNSQMQKLAQRIEILEKKMKFIEEKIIPEEELSEEEEEELLQLLKEPPENWIKLDELKKKLGL